MQGLPELLLLLQIPENFAPDALQALHLALALVHLTLQGLHAEGQLGMERQGVKGQQRRRRRKKRFGSGCGRRPGSVLVTESGWFGKDTPWIRVIC